MQGYRGTKREPRPRKAFERRKKNDLGWEKKKRGGKRSVIFMLKD